MKTDSLETTNDANDTNEMKPIIYSTNNTDRTNLLYHI